MTETQTTHTPGPWRLSNKALGSGLWPIEPDDGRTHIPICWVDFGRIDCESNSRLIAAAPELLEALRGVLESENDTHRNSDDRWTIFRQQARAAIAKATGGA